MLNTLLISVAAAIGYFIAGAVILALLRVTGILRRLNIGEEEQMIAAALWPAYMTIILPVYGAIALSKRLAGEGKHSKK